MPSILERIEKVMDDDDCMDDTTTNYPTLEREIFIYSLKFTMPSK